MMLRSLCALDFLVFLECFRFADYFEIGLTG